MKKRALTLIICLMIALLSSACEQSPAKRIEKMCGIELPKKIEVIFNYTEVPTQDTPVQYAVFQLKKEPAEFLNSTFFIPGNRTKSDYSGTLSFSDERNSDFEEVFDRRLAKIRGYRDRLMIPKEYYPDWESGYLHGKINGIAEILYFPNKLELVFYLYPSYWVSTY